MNTTDHKTETLRTAVASGLITMTEATVQRVHEGKVPKGNVLETARTAALMAAKRTPDLLPHCHPIGLDGVSVEFRMGAEEIAVEVTVRAVAKTGVEMEALTGVATALLTIYDMLKGIESKLEIRNVRLVEKRGGKSQFVEHIRPGFRAAVLVTSDGTYEGQRPDKSGKLIQERLASLGLDSPTYKVLPDDREQIRRELLRFCEDGFDLVITTGGTGLGPRDVTVEATKEVLERSLPGVAEAMRGHGQRLTPYAMLSRGLVGVRGKTMIVNLPGSSRGCEESMDAVFPALFHGYPMMTGGKH